jgi:hypothetical protein
MDYHNHGNKLMQAVRATQNGLRDIRRYLEKNPAWADNDFYDVLQEIHRLYILADQQHMRSSGIDPEYPYKDAKMKKWYSDRKAKSEK